MPTSAKKSLRVEFIRRYFFQDEDCRIPHQQVLAELDAEVNTGSSSAAAAPNPNASSRSSVHVSGALSNSYGNHPQQSTNTTRTCSSSYDMNPGVNGLRIPSPMPIDNFSVAAAAVFRPPSIGPIYSSSSTGGAGTDPSNFSGINFDPNTFFEPSSLTTIPPSAASNNNNNHLYQQRSSMSSLSPLTPQQLNQKRPAASSSTGGSNGNSSSGSADPKRARQEEKEDTLADPRKPSNPQEARLFSELQQMGFQDAEEMLKGIRHCQSSQTEPGAPPVRSDDVMVWIVSQREEAEEARKMDEARARSEQLRQENAARQKQAAKEKLAAAKLPELKNDLFKGSWILDAIDASILDPMIAKEASKATLVGLLEKEKQAKKFYAKGNSNLPEAYFSELCSRLSSNVETILDEMKKETTTLQKALYSLSEQQGGVPRIFLEANDRRKSSGRGDANDGDDDDDEIEILATVNAPPQASSSSPTPSDDGSDLVSGNAIPLSENGLNDRMTVSMTASDQIFEIE